MFRALLVELVCCCIDLLFLCFRCIEVLACNFV
jgi:hypothetical protein